MSRKRKVFKAPKIHGLVYLAQRALSEIKKNRDFFLCIGGPRGYGKSTIALTLAMVIQKLRDKKFDIWKYEFFDRADLEEMARISRKEVLILDEAVNIVYKRDFAGKNQRRLMKFFEMCREQNNIFIFNIPQIWSLDRDIRDGMIKNWLQVEEWGKAYLFKPSSIFGGGDCWNQKQINRNKDLWDEGVHPCNFYDCYESDIVFNKLPSSIYSVYEKVRAYKKSLLEETNKSLIINKQRMLDIEMRFFSQLLKYNCLRKGAMSFLSEKLNIGKALMTRKVNQWSQTYGTTRDEYQRIK